MYFSRPETDPFSGDYAAVLDPYRIYPMKAAATQTSARVSQQVYAASQQGDPTAFLLWHATPGLAKDRYPGRVSLLHSVIHYVSRMGRPPRKWDYGIFSNRGNVSYGTAPLTEWDPTYLHLALAAYVPSAAAINTSLSYIANLTLLGPYRAGNVGVEIIRCRKTLYFSTLYVGLLLGADLTPVEAWNRLRGAIIDAVDEDAC